MAGWLDGWMKGREFNTSISTVRFDVVRKNRWAENELKISVDSIPIYQQSIYIYVGNVALTATQIV